MRLKVLELFDAPRDLLMVAELLDGDVHVGVKITDGESCWVIVGISTSPSATWNAGLRGISVRPVVGSSKPRLGAELTEVVDAT